jgi:hypothetical protein
MDFPANWDFFPMADFCTAGPRNPGTLGVELLAQARPNGRVLDHFRVTLGGSRIIDVTAPMSALLLTPAASPWRFRYQRWPADIEIRRNMTSSGWLSVPTLLAARDATVEDEEGVAVPVETVLTMIEEANTVASIRFAVVIGEDQRMQLMLQSLPGTAEALAGKPALRG